jgi:putative ABC transport system permease protein
VTAHARRRVLLLVLLGESVRAVLRHKSRSALTALGITIGIAAVVWVVAIGRAGQERTLEQLQSLGDNLVWVEAGSRNVNGVRTGTRGTTTLTLEDADAIRREVHAIGRVSPNIDGRVLLASARGNWTTGYRGVTPDYLAIKRWEIEEGAAFTDDDVNRTARVCLLGKSVRDRLFGMESPIGQYVRIGVQPIEVVGVLAPKGQSANGNDQDDTVMLPYTTAQSMIRGKTILCLDDILCSAVSAEAVARGAAEIAALMRERHHITLPEEDDFNIRHPEELIKAQLETASTFARLLVTIASVALLVGGIGVMNVMLASVAERTREIGVRLAVGAPSWAVQMQFLTEAVVVSVLGGVLGVMASLGGSFVLERWLGWPMPIPAEAVVLAVAFSVAVGVLFGFYPAWRAARLDPVEALRRD